MGSFKDKFPGKYLKVEDLNGHPLAVTISRVAEEQVGPEKADRYVVYFHEVAKGFVISNRVNGESISELAGSEDPRKWVKTRIQLYPAKTEYQGKRVPCIRVEAPSGPVSKPAPSALSGELELSDDELADSVADAD